MRRVRCGLEVVCASIGTNAWARTTAVVARLSEDSLARRGPVWLAGRILRMVGTPARTDVSLGEALRTLLNATMSALDASRGRCRWLPRAGGGLLVLPCPHVELGRAVVDGTDALLREVSDGGGSLEAFLAPLVVLWQRPMETVLLANAAHAYGVPCRWPDETLSWCALGQGAPRVLWTPRGLGCHGGLEAVIESKTATAALLRSAGLPATVPRTARSATEAVRLAEELGFPVVIKPDRGRAQLGVWTGLADRQAVRAAFRRASAHAGQPGQPLVVERHHPGRYLRATMVGGRVAAAISSDAPVVRADGTSSAVVLLRRYFGLESDDALDARSAGVAEAVLAAQGLALQDVPESGARVVVGHANQGRHVDVTSSLAAAIVRICEGVARLFPLPTIGIDLLVQSPTRGLDARDVVLEVNAAPAFSMHLWPDRGVGRDLARPIVRWLFPEGPHAACAPVIGAPEGEAGRLERLARYLRAGGLHAAGYTRGHAWSGRPSERVGSGAAAAALLPLDSRADVLLLEVGPALLERGLGVDHLDLVTGTSSCPVPVGRILEASLRREPNVPQRLARACARAGIVRAVP